MMLSADADVVAGDDAAAVTGIVNDVCVIVISVVAANVTTLRHAGVAFAVGVALAAGVLLSLLLYLCSLLRLLLSSLLLLFPLWS